MPSRHPHNMHVQSNTAPDVPTAKSVHELGNVIVLVLKMCTTDIA
jgi:hypothetical protein